MRRQRWAIAVTVVMAVGSGCTSDPDNSINLGTAAPAPTTTPTTGAETTTSAATTTDPSIVASSTPTPAVTATSTTIVETTSTLAALDAVEAAFRSSFAELERCYYEPANCQYELIAVPDSPQDRLIRQIFAQVIADNQRSKPGNGEYSYKVEKVGVQLDTAVITVCLRDTITLFDVQDASNPDDDIIVNEGELWSRLDWKLGLVDGRWQVVNGQLVDAAQEAPLCEL